MQNYFTFRDNKFNSDNLKYTSKRKDTYLNYVYSVKTH